MNPTSAHHHISIICEQKDTRQLLFLLVCW